LASRAGARQNSPLVNPPGFSHPNGEGDRAMLRRAMLAALAGVMWAGSVGAEEAFTDPAKAGPDYAGQGEDKGPPSVGDDDVILGAQVIALGDGKFRGEFFVGGLPGEGWQRGDMQLGVDGSTENGQVTFAGDNGSAKIVDGKIEVYDPGGNKI